MRKRLKEVQAWYGMHYRCINHPHYAGRISVCKRWNDMRNFLDDMGPCPSRNHSLDRIDGRGNYEPENCRWATRLEQCSNKSNNILLTYAGETKTTAGWSRDKRCAVGQATLNARIRRGWSDVDAITAPRKANLGIKKGRRRTLSERQVLRKLAILQHKNSHARRLPIGVYKGKYAFLARMTIHQKVTHLGSFSTAKEAIAARKAAVLKEQQREESHAF